MIKKLIALILALLMVFSFAACSTADKDADSGEDTKQEEKEDKNEPAEEENEAEEEASNEDLGDLTFTETVVVDNDECAIKILSIDPDDTFGYTLKAEVENKSADKNYMFSVDSAAINGVSCDPFFASEVAAGKKAKEDITFMSDDIEEGVIGKYTEIELTFSVSDSDDWDADDVANETVVIYPYGEDKAVKFEREAKDTDNVIVDNEYATVIVTGYTEDEILGYSVDLFFVNKTDKNLMFSTDDVAVNGYMVDPFYAEEVPMGKCAFGDMLWMGTTLEDNDITDVEEIEFVLSASDNDDWSADALFSETIVLNP